MPTKKIISINDIEFCFVPKGKFLMGSAPQKWLSWPYGGAPSVGKKEHPQHTLDIQYDFWIARFRTTRKVFLPFAEYYYSQVLKLKDSAWDKWDYEFHENYPAVNTTWSDAIEYGKWLTNSLKSKLPEGYVVRIPTEAEWEKSARGDDSRIYPWGNSLEKNKCNITFDTNEPTPEMKPVGSYSPQGDSPYGCADMVGNGLEWTHSIFKPYPYSEKDGRENEEEKDNHVLRGTSIGYADARLSFREESWVYNCNDRGVRIGIFPPIQNIKTSVISVRELKGNETVM